MCVFLLFLSNLIEIKLKSVLIVFYCFELYLFFIVYYYHLFKTTQMQFVWNCLECKKHDFFK